MDVIGVIPARFISKRFQGKVIETDYDTIAVDTPRDLERVKEYLSNLKGLE